MGNSRMPSRSDGASTTPPIFRHSFDYNWDYGKYRMRIGVGAGGTFNERSGSNNCERLHPL